MHLFTNILPLVAGYLTVASAHTILTYPGWRGDNLHTSEKGNSSCVLGVDDYNGGTGWGDGHDGCFPYGMQWMYPCGGMPITTNRTKWPINGGAVAWQPGWFEGHSTAFIYVNLGFGTPPPNMSHPVVPVFQITGPTNDAYPGKQICLPQVPLPANITVKPGDNATIQLVEVAKHGAALYNCVDITFTDDMSEVREVNEDNCYNSSEIGFNLVFSTVSLTNAAPSSLASIPYTLMGIASLVAMVYGAGWTLL